MISHVGKPLRRRAKGLQLALQLLVRVFGGGVTLKYLCVALSGIQCLPMASVVQRMDLRGVIEGPKLKGTHRQHRV